MKKTFLFYTLMGSTLISYTQPAHRMQTLTKQEYQELGRSQKQQAWLFMGGGIVLTTAGILIANNATNSNKLDDLSASLGQAIAGVILIGGGVGGLIKSVSLFVKSGNNARTAASLSFNTQPVVAPAYHAVTTVLQPAITLRVKW